VEWVWSGAVASDEAEVRAHPRENYESVRLALSTESTLRDPSWIDPIDASGRVVGFRMTGLTADTEYHYAVEIDGVLDEVRTGTFTTFPVGPSSFTVAVGACARLGSNGAVFDAIRDIDPLLYLVVGDLHYGDTRINEIERYREVLDLTLTRSAQSALYRSTPVAYVWDDHDYGPNDADGNSPSRQAAMAAYREYVPSYELGGAESAVYQAFTIGRVRFVMTDARSSRNLDFNEERGTTSMLGAEQKAWFKDEIVDASQNNELVVWVNPVPWVAEERDGADHWGGFAAERRELADHIADNEIDNLVMVSGDAHMVAIDDGTNTDYSTDGYPGFPLLHSAALDRPGGIKGGPYSEGAIGDGGQFATIDVVDDGDSITVGMTGLTWDGDELMSYEFSTPEGAVASDE
jgi:phosphodiesterase/alkaline phosphatase D-like protein